MKRVLVVGLDGLSWKVLSAMEDPTYRGILERLVEGGVTGTLKSTMPPVSAPAWVSFATGKNPGKHGVFDFVGFRNRVLETSLLTSKDIGVATFYEILSEDGKKSVIIALPFSYPPREINGIMLADAFSPELYAIPKSAEKYLEAYRQIHDLSKGNTELILDILDVEKKKAEVARRLFLEETWDFFFVMFYGMDTICHAFFPDIFNRTDRGRKALSILHQEMEAVDWFMEHMDENTVMFVMSDHGFERKTKNFNVNVWLEQKGFLKSIVARDDRTRVSRFGGPEERGVQESSRKPVIGIPIPVGLIDLVLRIPRSKDLMNFILNGPLKNHRPGYKVTFDPRRTLAFFPTFGCFGIYINSTRNFSEGVIESEEGHNELVARLIRELRSLKSPRTDEPVFESVQERKELYSGEYTDFAPDILLLPNRDILLSCDMGVHLGIHDDINTGNHNLDGIFIAYGTSIREGEHIQSARIYDLAPTILHILGVNIPKDMDGRVLRNIFNEDTELSSRMPRYLPESEEKRINAKVKRLMREGRI